MLFLFFMQNFLLLFLLAMSMVLSVCVHLFCSDLIGGDYHTEGTSALSKVDSLDTVPPRGVFKNPKLSRKYYPSA